MRWMIVAAAVLGFVLVAAGAIGAHAVPIAHERQWDGALLFGFVHVLAALTAALLRRSGPWSLLAGWTFVAGVVLFSMIQMAKLLTFNPDTNGSPVDVLTILVPAGGIAFMAGWLLLAIAALRMPRDS
jgi:uncharacterized membrane protein YgdD (TMEM256/DUF423 family)